MTNKNTKIILSLQQSIQSARASIEAAEKWLAQLAQEQDIPLGRADKEALTETTLITDENGVRILEGTFDGQNMIDAEGKTYPVPVNYASKSKLVEGDTLKLTIQPSGAFLYKQIRPTARRLVVGNLILDGSQYKVLAEGKSYNVLYASVTFFRAKVGNEVTIILPEEGTARWAAIENVIPSGEEGEEGADSRE